MSFKLSFQFAPQVRNVSTYDTAFNLTDSASPNTRKYHKYTGTWRPEPIDAISPTKTWSYPGCLTDTLKVESAFLCCVNRFRLLLLALATGQVGIPV